MVMLCAMHALPARPALFIESTSPSYRISYQRLARLAKVRTPLFEAGHQRP